MSGNHSPGEIVNQVEKIGQGWLLKAMQLIVTLVVVPSIGWMLSSIMARLDKFDQSIQAFTTNAATTELRLQSVERQQAEEAARSRALQERVSAHDYELRRLDERIGDKQRLTR